MQHPYNQIAMSSLKKLVPLFGFLTFAGIGILYLIMLSGPTWLDFGRLSMAWNADTAHKIVSLWTAPQRITVAFLAGFDLVWGAVWVNWLALAFIYLSRRIQDPRSERRGNTWAYLAWLVWLLDIPENLSYYLMVLREPVDPWPAVFTLTMFIRWGFAALSLVVLFFWLIRAGKTEKYVVD